MMLNTALSEENERRAENVARRHVDWGRLYPGRDGHVEAWTYLTNCRDV